MGDLFLAQVPQSYEEDPDFLYRKPSSEYFVAAKVFNGSAEPYVNLPVLATSKLTGGSIDPVLKTDKNGVVVYPFKAESATIILSPIAPFGFFPSPESITVNAQPSGKFDPNDIAAQFTITKGFSFSWKTAAIVGGIALLGYYIWANQKK
jgi:hypothetical protein